jgi:hypothetical protein
VGKNAGGDFDKHLGSPRSIVAKKIRDSRIFRVAVKALDFGAVATGQGQRNREHEDAAKKAKHFSRRADDRNSGQGKSAQ